MVGRKEASVVREHPLVDEAVPAGSTTTVGGTKRGEATKQPSEETRRPMGARNPPSDYCIQHNLHHCLRATSHRRGHINITFRWKMSIPRWIIQGSRSFPELYPGRYSLRTCRILCRHGLREIVVYLSACICVRACTCARVFRLYVSVEDGIIVGERKTDVVTRGRQRREGWAADVVVVVFVIVRIAKLLARVKGCSFRDGLSWDFTILLDALGWRPFDVTSVWSVWWRLSIYTLIRFISMGRNQMLIGVTPLLQLSNGIGVF